MFVRWECGCIGVQSNHQNTEKDVVFFACDGDGDDYLSAYRKMESLTFEPLTGDEENCLVGKLSGLIGHGYRFRTIKKALAIKE